MIGLTSLATAPTGVTLWNPLRVVGGGFVSGIDIAADGTKVCRADTYGAYKLVGNTWVQIVNTLSMPSNIGFQSQQAGVYEIKIAPSNTQRLYMIFNGYVMTSINQGKTWTNTNFTQDTAADANDASYRGSANRLAIDPVNENVVIVGTPTNGVMLSINAGSTWTSVSGITASSPANGGYLVSFDPSSSVVSNKTQGIYISSYGAGVYHSTNGGSSAVITSSTPTTHKWMDVSSDGYVYLTTNDGGNGNATTIQVYTGSGSWTGKVVGSGGGNPFLEAATADPNTLGRVVVVDSDGDVSVSTDHGNTWTGKTSHTITLTDIPWVGSNSGATTGAIFGSSLRFDPTQSNVVYAGWGLGVLTGSPPSSQTTIAWTSQTSGIEQLVGNMVIKPSGGYPVLAAWDQGTFTSLSPNTAPLVKYPDVTGHQGGLQACWAIDSSPSTPSVLTAIINWPFSSSSGYSLDYGKTWTAFTTQPPNFGASGCERGGSVAMNGSSNIVVVGVDQGTNTNVPIYTTDRGETWNTCSFPGSLATTGPTGWGNAFFPQHKCVCSDQVTAGTFYAYNTSSGTYSSTNSGATWTQVNATPFSGALAFYVQIQAVPQNAGHVFCTLGRQNNLNTPTGTAFKFSTNGGSAWASVPNVTDVWTFGFGKAVSGGYPSMYIVGYVSSVWGIWRSDNANIGTPTWTQISTFPTNSFDQINFITGDPDLYGKVYVAFDGSGWAYGTLH